MSKDLQPRGTIVITTATSQICSYLEYARVVHKVHPVDDGVDGENTFKR